MSKFSGHKWRRGKRRNRQEAEGLDHEKQFSSPVPQNGLTGDSPKNPGTNGISKAKSAPNRHGEKSGAAQFDLYSTSPSKVGAGKNDGSSGALNSGSPNSIGLVVKPGSQEFSGRDENSFGEHPTGRQKRVRRKTRRDKISVQPASNVTSSKNEIGNKFSEKPASLEIKDKYKNKSESKDGEVSAAGEATQYSRKRRNIRRKGARTRSNEGALLRNIRSPVTPAPNVAYIPKPSAETPGKGSGTDNEQKSNSPRAVFARPRENALYAALDLGTNNCRLLIATPQERGKFRVVDGFSKIVRLGEGLAHSGRLSDGAMDRAVDALKVCSEKLMSHTVRGYRLIATEACRQAENGTHFLSRVKAETGMELEIIDRETEAYLAAEGCGSLMDKKADAAVLFDIGGGSSELILVNCLGRKKRISDQIVSWHSLPIGVVTLAERHGGANVNREVFQGMVDEVREHLSRFEGRDALSRIWKNGRVHLLGTSGTVTTLAGIHLGLPRYERRLVDGLWLSGDQVDRVIKDLLAMDFRQRAASPCIGSERADLVMAGCAILEGIRQFWPSDRLRVADRGLREGMLTQLIERDSAWLPPKTGRRRKQKFWNQNRSGSKGPNDNRNGQS